MRVVTVPNTVNGKTGLVCSYIGTAINLERLTISDLLNRAKSYVRGHSEPLDSSSVSDNGAMKSCAKNDAEVSNVRVTTMTTSAKCPKCSSKMNTDKHLHALGCEVELVKGGAFRDERIETRYCESCGYIELYRIAKNR